MELVQQFAKEIVSVLVALTTWMLNQRVRARLQVGQAHLFTYLVEEPLTDEKGEVLRPKQTVSTISWYLMNNGREPAKSVEVIFNWRPQYVNIWPPRKFREEVKQDDRYILTFDNLAPSEQIQFELLAINRALPELMLARSEQSVARQIPLAPMRVIPAWARRALFFLLLAGLSASVYVVLLVVQFVVLKSPLL